MWSYVDGRWIGPRGSGAVLGGLEVKIGAKDKSSMWVPQPELGERIQAALDRRGWNEADLVREIERVVGVPDLQAAISGYLGRGERKVKSGKYFWAVEKVLGISLLADHVAAKSAQSGHFDIDTSPITTALSQPLPLYNTTAGAGGVMLMEMIAGTQCDEAPAALVNVRNAYGVLVVGTVMEPAYRPGDTIWLNPKIKGRPGDDVLMLPVKPDTNRSRCLRELLSETAAEWVVRQHNPSKVSNLLKSVWPTCIKIHSTQRR